MRATAPDGHGILKIPNPVQSYPEPPDLSKALGGEMYKVSRRRRQQQLNETASDQLHLFFQVNIDLSQFLYHEVFGKLPNDHHPPGNHLPLHPNLMPPHAPPPHGPPLHHHASVPVVPGSATSSSSLHDGGMAPIMSLAGNNGPMGPPGSAGPGQQPPGHGHPGGQSSINLDQKPDPATMMVAPPPGTELGEIKYSAGDMESHNCEVCGKSFQFRYQLIVHRRYHVERKPFTCQVSWMKSILLILKQKKIQECCD